MYQEDSCAHSTQKTAGNVRVNVGIDEELRMILELDPDIIDLGSTLTKPVDILSGFPPFSGGWDIIVSQKSNSVNCSFISF